MGYPLQTVKKGQNARNVNNVHNDQRLPMRLAIAIGVTIICGILLAGFFYNKSQIDQATVPLPKESSTTITGQGKTDLPTTSRITPIGSGSPTNRFNASCPPGQYNYGMPLGCVSNRYRCTKNCPQ